MEERKALWLRSRPLDVSITLLALLFGAPSLYYVPGLDQALFEYVGSGWLQGAWPYADAFDQKPPGIFVVHALVAALCHGAFCIRALDLILVVAIGWLAAIATAGRGEREDGRLGIGALLASGYYYSCFNYWNTAQTEIWQGFLLVTALCTVLSGRPGWKRLALAGALSGAAFLFKYSAIVPAAAVGVVGAWRVYLSTTDRDTVPAARSLLCFASGAAVAVLLGVAPFFFSGQGAELWDATIELNYRYVDGVPMQWSGLTAFLTHWSFPYSAFLVLAILATGLRLRHRPAFRAGAILLLLLACFGAVALQRRFFIYHFALLLPFIIGTALCSLDNLSPRQRWLRPAIAVVVVTLCFVWPPKRPGFEGVDYREQATRALRYAAGEATRDEFLASFVGFDGFDYLASERAGQLIRGRAGEGDTLCVVGYQPVFYLVSGLRCPSRFFATHLVSTGNPFASRPSEPSAYAAEHVARMIEHPPTFMAQRTPLRDGYRPIGQFGEWFVLERDSPEGAIGMDVGANR